MHRWHCLLKVCAFLEEVHIRLRILAACYGELGQTIQTCTHQGMLRLWHLLPEGERIQVKPLCSHIVSQGKIDMSQPTKGIDDQCMLESHALLIHDESLQKIIFGLAILPLLIQEIGNCFQTSRSRLLISIRCLLYEPPCFPDGLLCLNILTPMIRVPEEMDERSDDGCWFCFS